MDKRLQSLDETVGNDQVNGLYTCEKHDADRLQGIFEQEELYGTEGIVWFDEYKLHLPYWVSYMPQDDRDTYVAIISKTRDFE